MTVPHTTEAEHMGESSCEQTHLQQEAPDVSLVPRIILLHNMPSGIRGKHTISDIVARSPGISMVNHGREQVRDQEFVRRLLLSPCDYNPVRLRPQPSHHVQVTPKPHADRQVCPHGRDRLKGDAEIRVTLGSGRGSPCPLQWGRPLPIVSLKVTRAAGTLP